MRSGIAETLPPFLVVLCNCRSLIPNWVECRWRNARACRIGPPDGRTSSSGEFGAAATRHSWASKAEGARSGNKAILPLACHFPGGAHGRLYKPGEGQGPGLSQESDIRDELPAIRSRRKQQLAIGLAFRVIGTTFGRNRRPPVIAAFGWTDISHPGPLHRNSV